MRNRNPETFGGGCVMGFFVLLVVLALCGLLGGRTNLPGIVLGWIF